MFVGFVGFVEVGEGEGYRLAGLVACRKLFVAWDYLKLRLVLLPQSPRAGILGMNYPCKF